MPDQVHRAGLALTVLGQRPLGFLRLGAGIGVVVVSATVNRGHDVGILLQAAAVAQVGELGTGIASSLDLAV